MLIDPAKVTLRVGTWDPSYLNIDYDGKEVGYVKKTSEGMVWWAHEVSSKPLVVLVQRCLVHG